MFSVILSQLKGVLTCPCPFLSIVIGSPLEPVEDQLLEDPVTVEPYLILFPNLPSYIISPSNAFKG